MARHRTPHHTDRPGISKKILAPCIEQVLADHTIIYIKLAQESWRCMLNDSR